jgi:hypothetical protein
MICASQEHTRRPENIELAVRQFTVANAVAFVVL